MKVLVLHDTMSPYRMPLFKKIADLSPHEFSFTFVQARNRDREWDCDSLGLDISILKTWDIPIGSKTLHVWMDYRKLEGFDVLVLNDHLNFPSLVGLAYGRAKGVPCILWSDNTVNALNDLPTWQVVAKRSLAKLYGNYLTPGSLGREYFREFGVDEKRIHVCHNVVDNDRFSKARSVSEQERNTLKKELGLQGPVVMYCGQFVTRKGLDVLVDAMNKLDPGIEFSFLALGNGSLKTSYAEAFAASRAKAFALPGFIQQDDLYKYYAVADVFVLPAYIDHWGMVVNEAMAAGVPVILSDGVGAHPDLVEQGVSGFVFEKGNAEQLSEALTRTLSDADLRASMVKNADQILESYTLEYAARQFIRAVEKVYAE